MERTDLSFPRMCAGALLALLAGLAGCSAGKATSQQSPASTPTNATLVALGFRKDTAKGSVVVYAYDPAVPASATRQPAAGTHFVAIDAEGCGGSNADERTGIAPQLFYLQIDPSAYHPVDPVKEPSLHETVLAPGGCARGWITFEIPDGSKPTVAIFRSSEVIGWRIP